MMSRLRKTASGTRPNGDRFCQIQILLKFPERQDIPLGSKTYQRSDGWGAGLSAAAEAFRCELGKHVPVATMRTTAIWGRVMDEFEGDAV